MSDPEYIPDSSNYYLPWVTGHVLDRSMFVQVVKVFTFTLVCKNTFVVLVEVVAIWTETSGHQILVTVLVQFHKYVGTRFVAAWHVGAVLESARASLGCVMVKQ